MYYNTILDVIGNTPLVRINKLNPNPRVTMLAKLEFLNPGGSTKDRIGLAMIAQAEKEGKLKKGGTIVEPTSGNTGVGLAMAAAIRGYKTVFVMPDKMSEEKRNLLRAYGARVVVTPTGVPAKDPRSYYSVSDRLAVEIPGAFKPNQYANIANPQSHEATTGPEIWEQSEGKVTHAVIGMGTGGTITGIARYLKKKNPKIRILGIDPVGSLYYHYFKTGKLLPDVLKTYKVEGVGEDFLPSTIDFSLIDDVIQIADKECFTTARALARLEGILTGGSGGMAIAGARRAVRRLKEGVVVVILPDSGRNYLSKFYNDEWMRDFGFLEEPVDSIVPLLNKKLHFISIASSASPQEAITLMRKYQISQMPVVDGKHIVGTISEVLLIQKLYGKEKIPVTVAEIMDTDVSVLSEKASMTQLAAALARKEMVVIVDKKGKPLDVLTRIDLLSHITQG